MLFDILQFPLRFACDATISTLHTQSKIEPTYPLETLRSAADWVPLKSISDELHRRINLCGDLISGNHNLSDEWELKKWKEVREQQLLQRLAEVCASLPIGR